MSGRFDSPARPFNLTRWFLVLSFISIALTSAVSAALLTKFLTANMLRRDAVVSQEFVNSIVRAEHAEALFLSDRSAAGTQKMLDLFEQIANIPDVLRANIFARDRSILWSSAPELIGVEFRTNPDLDRAFLGALAIEHGAIGEVKKAEHAFLEGVGPRFIENYLPVHGAAGRIIGVVELYKSPSDVIEAIRVGSRLVWVSAGLGGLLLYLVLFWIIRRANRLIGEQQRRLVASEALTAMGEMASAVAHGLRNPLASIRSSAELALVERPPEELRESLDDIVSQSDRLEGWIRELLSDARPMAGEFEKISMEALVRACVKGFSTQFERQRITVELDIDAGLAPVNASAGALRQVLNSLLSNAIEAMPEGGRLQVRAACEATGERLRVEVADSGKGVSEAHARKLFQPFVTTKGTGLGVGLYLARRIMDRHHGSLELENSSLGGTAASIRIPTAD